MNKTRRYKAKRRRRQAQRQTRECLLQEFDRWMQQEHPDVIAMMRACLAADHWSPIRLPGTLRLL